MPGLKRAAPDPDPGAAAAGDLHPSRRRRVELSDADAALSKLYGELADEVQAVRLKAAGQLVKNLSAVSEGQTARIESATTRLVKGLCSGRKGARLGFSVALAEVLRLGFRGGSLGLGGVVERVEELTKLDGGFSGLERRDHLLGRRFAWQSVLQSDVAFNKACPAEHWRGLQDAIARLAAEKPWIRRECGQVLVDYLKSPSGKKLSPERAEAILPAWKEQSLLKTPEGLALWLTVCEYPKASTPAGVWERESPLHSKNRSILAKVMLNTVSDAEDHRNSQGAGTREVVPSIAWTTILSYMDRRRCSKEDVFEPFWEDVVEKGLFGPSASVERRSLGLQVVSLAVLSVPSRFLMSVVSPRALRCILDQRVESSRYLYEAAKAPLNAIVKRCSADEEATVPIMDVLLTHAGPNMDQATKTKTLETLISQASPKALSDMLDVVYKHLGEGGSSTQQQLDEKRRKLADLLLTMMRTNRTPEKLFTEDDSLAPWSIELLHVLVQCGYTVSPPRTNPALSDSIRSTCRTRLMSCLNVVLEAKLELAVQGPQTVAGMLLKLLESSNLALPLEANAKQALELASTKISDVDSEAAESKDAPHYAFQLLFHMSVLQVYNQENDSASALEDLCASWDSWQESSESSTMILELLLSFVSKPSALFRKLAEQAFSAFAAEMTAEGLQSMLDILSQKESLAGQQELFQGAEDEDEEDEEDDASEADGDAIDVEDDSDVELINGEQAEASDSEASSSDNNSDTETEADAANDESEDEEAAFDRKLAAALGTNGLEGGASEHDSDSDGSSMDDEQMMALDGHLINIFKERKKTSSKKQDNKDAKENIVNFKNRVLDLLAIYVKKEYANVLALDLLMPLAVLVRETGSKQTAEKGFAVLKTWFEACSKHKALPEPEDSEVCFKMLGEVHQEMKLGGSKLHANACSRASLFLSKVLVGLDAENYKRVAGVYAESQSEWWLDSKSRVQGSVFTEFTSWSIGTRKQK